MEGEAQGDTQQYPVVFHSYNSMGLAEKVSQSLLGEDESGLSPPSAAELREVDCGLIRAHLEVFKGTDAQNGAQQQQSSLSVYKHAVVLQSA